MRDLDEAVSAVQRIDRLDRAALRATFEKRFTVERMAKEYLAIYRGLPAVRRATMRSNIPLMDALTTTSDNRGELRAVA